MKKVILFGAGQRLKKVIDILSMNSKYEIIEIWDNDILKKGKKVNCGNQNINISLPHKVDENVLIIITSSVFEKEIRNQLTNDLLINDLQIKPWNYCFEDIKEKIISNYCDDNNEEIQETIQYLENNYLDEFNNKQLNKKYDINSFVLEIFKDEENGLLYSYWKGKKIYLKRSFQSRSLAKDYLVGLMREQDSSSPHCYEQVKYTLNSNDVVVDGGAAEGFFSLEKIDKVAKIYLVEGDGEWIEALRYTFFPYKDKVEIIEKWLSDVDDNNNITIDAINRNRDVTIIKLDIEGAEQIALRGAKNTLKDNKKLNTLVCTYHKSDDANVIEMYMKDLNFNCTFSKGVMFFPYEDTVHPELRKAVLFASKG